LRYIATILILCLVATRAEAADETRYDDFLLKIIRVFNLRPLPTKPFEETPKYRLGRALFFDPLLSGNRDISCATCHLLHRGTTDALPLAIGTGGTGLANERTLPSTRPQQPRNALDLWNRDNNSVRTMFWDGRIEELDPVKRAFRSPLGTLLPAGLENLMAVQALFPLAREDEMLGLAGDRSPSDLPAPHANCANELASGSAHLEGAGKIERVLEGIMERLLGGKTDAPMPWHSTYRALFREAYPDVNVHDISVVQAANAIAHFEEIAFATRDTPWDEFLRGNRAAIDASAKRGAFLFFGKARCVACHRGPLFSDFEFHAIGVPNFGPGFEPPGEDLGRYRVTGDPSDKYKFRTPPLRNVTLTAPYFHNGSASTLDEAIRQHLDPLTYADKYRESGEYMMNVDQINAISPILTTQVTLSKDEITALESFLMALQDRGPANIDKIILAAVPSGLPVAAVAPKP
jgi:cytochrome c peroxidase